MSETQWHILIFMAIVAVSLEGLLLVGVARQLGSVLLLVHPPRPGTMDMGPALGDLVESPHLERARPGVLVFVAPGCGVCDQLKPSIPAFARSYRDIQTIVFTGARDAKIDQAYTASFSGYAVDDREGLTEQLGIAATPYGVAVDESHRVLRRGVVNTLDHLESLAQAIVDPKRVDPEARTGDAAASLPALTHSR